MEGPFLNDHLVPSADVEVGDRCDRLRGVRHPDQRGRAPRLRALQRHARRPRQRQGTQLRHSPRWVVNKPANQRATLDRPCFMSIASDTRANVLGCG